MEALAKDRATELVRLDDWQGFHAVAAAPSRLDPPTVPKNTSFAIVTAFTSSGAWHAEPPTRGEYEQPDRAPASCAKRGHACGLAVQAWLTAKLAQRATRNAFGVARTRTFALLWPVGSVSFRDVAERRRVTDPSAASRAERPRFRRQHPCRRPFQVSPFAKKWAGAQRA